MIIIFGCVGTTGMMKLLGYPDQSIDWRKSSVFVRNFNFVFLTIPLVWGGLTAWVESQNEESALCAFMYLLAPLICMGLGMFFLVTSFSCAPTGIISN